MSGGRRSTARWRTPAEEENKASQRQTCVFFVLLAVRRTNLFGTAAFARFGANSWHGHRGRGGLGVLGVGLRRAVADLFGGRGGRDLHPLAAFH